MHQWKPSQPRSRTNKCDACNPAHFCISTLARDRRNPTNVFRASAIGERHGPCIGIRRSARRSRMSMARQSNSPMTDPAHGPAGRETLPPGDRPLMASDEGLDDRFFRQLVFNLRTGVLAITRPGRVAAMNDMAYRVLGLAPRRSDIGRPSRGPPRLPGSRRVCSRPSRAMTCQPCRNALRKTAVRSVTRSRASRTTRTPGGRHPLLQGT